MSKLPMYIILGVCMTLGSLVPALFGQSVFGGWSLFGTFIGGIIGIVIYWKARESGYLS